MSRHRILLLLGCIAMGAVVNIAVAWTFAIRNDARGISFQTTSVSISDDQAREIWQRYLPSPAFGEAGNGVMLKCAGVAEFVVYRKDYRISPSDGAPDVACEWRFGWPLPALLTGAHQHRLDQFQTSWQPEIEIAAIGLHRGQRLPIGPVWSGIAVNTIFFTGVIWLMIRGPAETRRRWRELRGNCGRCGYPRGTSAVCTECGADLTRAWGRSRS